MPPSVADGYVILKPRSKWADPSKPKSVVVAELERKANGVPGSKYEFTQPIEMRFNELIAGVRTDVAFTIFGDDPDQLQESAEKVAAVIGAISGAADVRVEQVSGLPQIEISPRRDVIGRMGVNISEVQDAVSVAYAGREVSRFYQGPRSLPVVVRLGEGDRNKVESLQRLPIPLPITATKAHDPFQGRGSGLEMEESERLYTELGVVASIVEQEGPNQISHENGRRRIVVTANVRGRDVGSFVAHAQAAIASGVTLPTGYWSKWGGQYEHLIGAERRLMVVVPIVLLCVFGLIVVTFRSLRYSLLVFSGIPFALSGGVLALWILGIPFSISAAVGFIALSGVSVLNGLVLVTFVRQLLARGVEPLEAIIEGTIARVRPVLMTALVASLGFVPMAISTGTGSEVQRPLATVVIGGIISATTLTLLVLPVLLAVFARARQKVA
jgi:cobalt-zinc-cadmium resistance protein CzcA